jgi:PAS domain S-box-containing protein
MQFELSRLIEALPGLVWTASPDGRAELVNRRWCNYTGLGPDQAAGSGWQRIVHPHDLASVLERWRAMLASGTPGEAAARLRRYDGAYRRFLVSAAPIANPSGRVIKWCCIDTDIEEQLSVAESALSAARAELAHVARVMTVGAMTASIAHEINQPLSGIITNASTCLRMLAADPPNLDGARATAQRTLRDGNRASEVIQRLRGLFARRQPAIEPVDLNDAAREVLALSSSELQRGRIILRTEFDAALPAVIGDRVQLQQVILNLILNAADAMRTIEDRPRDLQVHTALVEAQQVCLSVRDCGVGFDAGNPEKLFEAFYTTKSHGMGVGLSISRSIIESHQGRLWASANEGPGATFSFSLPCASAR